MIQYIGLMIGIYIIVRMVQILATKTEPQVTKILNHFCLLATLYFMLGMMVSGAVKTPSY